MGKMIVKLGKIFKKLSFVITIPSLLYFLSCTIPSSNQL